MHTVPGGNKPQETDLAKFDEDILENCIK